MIGAADGASFEGDLAWHTTFRDGKRPRPSRGVKTTAFAAAELTSFGEVLVLSSSSEPSFRGEELGWMQDRVSNRSGDGTPWGRSVSVGRTLHPYILDISFSST